MGETTMAQDLDAELDDLELRKNLGIHPSWRDPAQVGAAAHAPPPPALTIPRLPGPPAAGTIPGAAAARAAKLASDAMALELAQAAGDPLASRETVRLLLAHQVAAGHSLMMRLTAIADAYVNYVQPAAMRDPYLSRCPQEAVRLAHGAARLMERVRAGALALQRLGYPGSADPMPPAPQPPRHPPSGPENNPDPSRPRDNPPHAPAPMPHPAQPAAALLRRGRLNNGNPVGDFLAAPRCGAATRAGHACAQPAMANGRCRFHGGKSTGPRTADGLPRARNARLVHGFRSGALIKLRSNAAHTARELQRLTDISKQERFTTEGTEITEGTRFQRRQVAAGANAVPARPLAAPTNSCTEPQSRPAGDLRFSVISVPSVVDLTSSSPRIIPAGRRPALFPAGHGVHRSDLSLPLELHRAEALAKADPVQSAPFAATTSGPRNRARP
jgi:hypothetical protein